MPMDEVYIIYGPETSGKTVAASTFPKPMAYVDVKEGGTGSIPAEYAPFIDVIPVDVYEDFANTLEEIRLAPRGTYASLVIDSGTNVEELLKEWLKRTNGKTSMNKDLWGKVNENHALLASELRRIHRETGIKIVVIYHERELENEVNPHLSRLIPSITPKASKKVCAKASYIWYMNVEHVQQLQEDNTVKMIQRFYGIVDTHPGLSAKCRKPPGLTTVIPQKVYNLTYQTFEREVLYRIRQAQYEAAVAAQQAQQGQPQQQQPQVVQPPSGHAPQ